MKSHSFLRHLPSVALAAATLVFSSSAHAQSSSWDGGNATNGSWGAAANWVGDIAPTFGTSANLTFDNVTRAITNEIGGNRTVRSITFGDNIDTTWTTNMTTGAVLTFSAASGNASLNVTSGSTGNITLNGGTGFTGSQSLTSQLEINHNGVGLLTFNRQTSGVGGITKAGTGTALFTGFNANSFTGPVNVNGGRLVFNNTQNATADLASAVNINLGGGTLEMRTSGAFGKTVSQNITVSAASSLVYNNTTATTQTFLLNTGSMVLDADLTVQNISANTTAANLINISRNLTGTGDVIVDSYNNVNSGSADFAAGRVAFGGNNTGWSGDLIIRQGSAQVFGNSTLGQVNVGTGNIVLGETGNSFGAAFLTGAGLPAGPKTIANEIIVRSGGFRTIRGGSDHTYNFTGNVTLEGDLNIHNGLFFTDKSMIFTGNISGVGGLSITESGNPGFTRLSGNNTYSGATSIGANAVLNILGGSSIGDTSAVSFSTNSTLAFNASSETVGSIASSGTDGAINLGANTLTTGGNNQTTSFGGSINGVGGGLTKVGSGTMTLDAANTYTGTTTVSAGTLIIQSTNTAATTSVEGAARIGGDGSLSGTLSLASGAQFVFSITSTLDVTGLVTLDNSFGVISLVNADGSAVDWSVVSEGSYSLIGNVGGDFSNISNFGIENLGGLGAGKSGYFENANGLGLVVVPEPQVWALFAIGLASVFLFRLRRRSA